MKHIDSSDCGCVLCATAALLEENADQSPWCGTCQGGRELAAKLRIGSPEYRRAFLEWVSDPDAERGGPYPVPAALDPTVKP